MGHLDGKLAIVTGGLGGMGQAICGSLAEAGADICAVDVIDPTHAQTIDLAGGRGRNAVYHKTDITDGASAERLFASVSQQFGGVDILVNCAGLVGRRDATITDPVEERDFYMQEPYEEWLKVMQVNVWGAQLMVTCAVPLMKARGGGTIVTISSLAGRFGAAAAALSYTASKAALIGLSKQWAKMFGRDGIRSNAIAPGPTQTAMLDSMSDEKKENFRKATLTGRISVPEDIAKAVCFLSSNESANITGQVLEINGGCWLPA
jgi:NAD(P)-dependent dehydrogenase (short-subunit alcohol dehydrogenase family)